MFLSRPGKRFKYETENLGSGEKFSESKSRKLPLKDLGRSEEVRLLCSLLGEQWSLSAFTVKLPFLTNLSEAPVRIKMNPGNFGRSEEENQRLLSFPFCEDKNEILRAGNNP